MMYGKRRIVFTKDGKIILAGGKCYHPIGKWSFDYPRNNAFKIVVLKPEHRWDRDLRINENAVQWLFHTKTEARTRVSMMWSNGIGG
jgi:hypothetical protein